MGRIYLFNLKSEALMVFASKGFFYYLRIIKSELSKLGRSYSRKDGWREGTFKKKYGQYWPEVCDKICYYF